MAYDGCPLLQIPSRLLDFAKSADNEDGVVAAREQIGSHEQKYAPSVLVKAADNSVAYVMYTSGSTGSPQAVLGTAEGESPQWTKPSAALRAAPKNATSWTPFMISI